MTLLEAMFASIGIDFRPIKTLYVVSDSPTSQYRNKKICFLMSKFASDNDMDVCWIYTEKGHGKGPVDGVGAAVKTVITDTISYHPKSVIRNTEQLMTVLPEMNVDISTYLDSDVKCYIDQLPRPLRTLKFTSDCGFNIGTSHELLICDNGKSLKVKKLSSDESYSSLHLSMTRKEKKKGKKKVISVEDARKIQKKDKEENEESDEEDTEESAKEDTEESDKEDTEESAKEDTEESAKEDTEESNKEDTEESDKEDTEESEKEESEDDDDTPEEKLVAQAAQASLDDDQCAMCQHR